MHYLVQDVIFIALVLIGFLALYQGAQNLLRRLIRYQQNHPSSANIALRDMNRPP